MNDASNAGHLIRQLEGGEFKWKIQTQQTAAITATRTPEAKRLQAATGWKRKTSAYSCIATGHLLNSSKTGILRRPVFAFYPHNLRALTVINIRGAINTKCI